MIGVIDYGRGNLFSLGQALRSLARDFTVTQDAEALGSFETLILPGVGAFGDAMTELRARGLDEALALAAARGQRILGICLGMQLLATRSEEFGDHAGLDLVPGNVRRLPDPAPDDDDAVRIPNIGWRRVTTADGRGPSLADGNYFYFVHSFGFTCNTEMDLAASITVNGREIAAIVGRDNVWGCQFHPEKSAATGLRLLDQLTGE